MQARHKPRIDSYRGPAARFSFKNLEEIPVTKQKLWQQQSRQSGTIFTQMRTAMLSRPKYLIHYSESFRNQSSPMEQKSRTAVQCIQWLPRHKHWHRTSSNSTEILDAPHNRKINPYRGPAARFLTEHLGKFHQQSRKLRRQQIFSRKPVSPKKGTELLVLYTGQMNSLVQQLQ